MFDWIGFWVVLLWLVWARTWLSCCKWLIVEHVAGDDFLVWFATDPKSSSLSSLRGSKWSLRRFSRSQITLLWACATQATAVRESAPVWIKAWWEIVRLGCWFLKALLRIEEHWPFNSKRGFGKVLKITFDETSLKIVAKSFANGMGVWEAFLLSKWVKLLGGARVRWRPIDLMASGYGYGHYNKK